MKLLLILSCILSSSIMLPSSWAIPVTVNEEKKPKANLIQNGIVRSYVSGGVLDREDEAIVLKLAQKRGIETVGKISTHYMLPSSAKAIQVEGIAKREGREVTIKTLNITRKEWTFPKARPGKNDLILGDFWSGRVYLRKQVELNVNGKSYLCSSVTGMSFEEAETFLGMFLEKKFKVSSIVRQNTLDQVDWSQPTRFTKRGDSISIGFLARGRSGGFFDLQIKKENNLLTILQMMQAMP